MHMEDLPFVLTIPRPVGIATPVLAVVGNDNQLEHVVVKGQSHLVECLHILVQCGDRPDIGLLSEV